MHCLGSDPSSGFRNLTSAILVGALLFAPCAFVQAQPAKKVPRIGVLEPGTQTANVCNAGFRRGLRGLGYMENESIVLQTRYAESVASRLAAAAAEIVKLKPDVIWTHSPASVLAAKRATTAIPIVVGVARDLVEQGIVSSLARPGGNITGMELRDSEIIGKRLELLRQAIPSASRVAVLVNPNDPGHAAIPGNLEAEVRALRIQLQRVEASGPEVFDTAFRTISRSRAEALLLPESAMLSEHRQRILKLAMDERLPSAAGGPHFAEAGSLISYGASVTDVCQRSAIFVDKILKGAKPADLPVERPAKIEFVVNLKTAKQIGVTIPQWVLVKADRVIR